MDQIYRKLPTAKFVSLVVIACCACLGLGANNAQASYEHSKVDPFKDLPAISGGVINSVSGINDSGKVVGSYLVGNPLDPTHPSSVVHGFIYDSTGYTPFDRPGFTNTQLTGVNNVGKIVGQSDAQSFIYDSRSTGDPFETIFCPGANSVQVTGINDAGVAVGMFETGNALDPIHPTSTLHGFIYSNGVCTPKDRDGFSDTQLTAINNVGQITGISYGPGHPSFIYANGNFTPILLPSGIDNAVPRGINDAGKVVGQYVTGNPLDPANPIISIHGFTYDTVGGFLPFDRQGFDNTDLAAINNVGQMLGFTSSASGASSNFIFQSASSIQAISEIHIGQVILDPSWSHQAVIDVVNGKAMFAILKLKNADGTALAGKLINNLIAKYDTVGNGNLADFYTGRIPSPKTNITDDQGQIYFIFPGAFSLKASGALTDIFIEYDDPISRNHVSNKSTQVAFWKTKSAKIGYSEISDCRTSNGLPLDCYGPMSSNFNFQENINKSTLFLGAVFPIKDDGIVPVPLQSFKGFPDDPANGIDGICLDLRYAKQIVDKWEIDHGSTRLEKTAVFVPITSGGRQSYFTYHYPPPHPAWSGESEGGRPAVFVNEGSFTTVAHEFGHSYCVRFDGAFGCSAGAIPASKRHFNCDPNPLFPDNCDANISGYNGVDSPLFDPRGPISKKLPFFGDLFVPFSDHLELTWIDPSTYLQLFREFVLRAKGVSGLGSVSGIRIGVRLDVNGSPVLEYASPTVFDPGLDNQGVESDVIFVGMSKTNDQLFSVKAQSQGQGIGMRQFEAGGRADDFDCGATKEYVVNYGYDLDKVVVQGSNRGTSLTIVPSLAVLQTQVAALEDAVFTGNAGTQKEMLLVALRSAQSAYAAGDAAATNNYLNVFSSLLQTELSDSFVPSDGLQITKANLSSGVQDAVIRTVGAGQSNNVQKNGIITVAQIYSNTTRSYLGQRLTSPSDPRNELLIRAFVGGVARDVALLSDGSFVLKLLSTERGVVKLSSVLRNRRDAGVYLEGIERAEEQITALDSALETVQDPLFRERLVLQINDLKIRAQSLSAKRAGLEKIVGSIIQF